VTKLIPTNGVNQIIFILKGCESNYFICFMPMKFSLRHCMHSLYSRLPNLMCVYSIQILYSLSNFQKKKIHSLFQKNNKNNVDMVLILRIRCFDKNINNFGYKIQTKQNKNIIIMLCTKFKLDLKNFFQKN